MIAQQSLVIAVVRRPGDGKLLFAHRPLKRRDRLEVLSQLVVKKTEGIVTSPQEPVMQGAIRIGLDEFFEDIKRHPKRQERLVILMDPVLYIGDHLIGFAEVLSKLRDRRMGGDELGSVLERFFQRLSARSYSRFAIWLAAIL